MDAQLTTYQYFEQSVIYFVMVIFVIFCFHIVNAPTIIWLQYKNENPKTTKPFEFNARNEFSKDDNEYMDSGESPEVPVEIISAAQVLP